jgi:hypothetical protein
MDGTYEIDGTYGINHSLTISKSRTTADGAAIDSRWTDVQIHMEMKDGGDIITDDAADGSTTTDQRNSTAEQINKNGAVQTLRIVLIYFVITVKFMDMM